MSRIRECLTPSVAIELVNSLIEGQPIQKHLIEWKKKYSNDEEGKVGRSYWRSFLKRNNHRLISTRGQKYELNRQNWTTYANFRHMYNHIYNEMVDAGVAEPLGKSIWMDIEGNECLEEEAVGCQVTHKLCHPDMCNSLSAKIYWFNIHHIETVI